MKRTAIFSALILAACVAALIVFDGCSKPDPDPDPTGPHCVPVSATQRTQIDAGLADLDLKDVQAAFVHFETAYLEDGGPNEVKFWYAIVRLMKWCEDNMNADGPNGSTMDSAKELLDAMGCSNIPGERNLMDFSATFPEDVNGDYVPPSTVPDADEVVLEYLRDVFLVELQACLDILDTICNLEPCTCFHYQSAEFTNSESFEIDYADVCTLRAGLYVVKGLLHFLAGYDYDGLDSYTLYQEFDAGTFDLNDDVLTPYVDLGKIGDVTQFANFESAIKTALAIYKDGALALRAETDDQTDDIVTIGDPDNDTPQELTEARYHESEVRDIIENQFEYSIDNGQVTLVDIETHDPTDAPGTMVGWLDGLTTSLTINLQPLFTGVNLRALLPVFNSACEQFVDPLPDPTLGGVLPGKTAQEASWDAGLLIIGGTIPTATITIDGSSADWASVATFYTDRSGDDDDESNGVTLTGADINELKIARDATNLYVYMSFNGGTVSGDGNPTFYKSWQMEINPFAISSPDPEYDVNVYFQNGSPTATLNGPGVSGTSYVALGLTFIEFYIPLTSIGSPGAGARKVFSCRSYTSGSTGTVWGSREDRGNNEKTGDF